MRAAVGDRITVRGNETGQPDRSAIILAVEGSEGTASSRAAQPKTNGRNDRAAQPLPGVAALCAAGPRGRRSRPLEAEGREGAVKQADAASSRGSAGEAAPAAGAKRRPARCLVHCASNRAGKQSIEIRPSLSYVARARRRDESNLTGVEA